MYGVAAGTFSFTDVSHLELHGLGFQYGEKLSHNLNYPTAGTQYPGFVVQGCHIHSLGDQGILGGAEGSIFTDNWIDRIGPRLLWRDNKYRTFGLKHNLYLNGNKCLVQNNVLSRCPCGLSINAMGGSPVNGLQNGTITDNLCLDTFGVYVSGSGWTAKNNVLLGIRGRMNGYPGASNYVIAENYLEGQNPLCMSDYTGKFVVTDNVVNKLGSAATGGCVEVFGKFATPSDAMLDRNTYLGTFVGSIDDRDKPQDTNYVGFDAWKRAVQALPGCSAWEANSRSLPQVNRQFDPTVLDGLLNELSADQIRRVVARYVERVKGEGTRR